MVRFTPCETCATTTIAAQRTFLPLTWNSFSSARTRVLTAAAFCTLSCPHTRNLPHFLPSIVEHKFNLDNSVNGFDKSKTRTFPITKQYHRLNHLSSRCLSSSSNANLNVSSSSSTNRAFLPSDYPRLDDLKPALSAIRKACRITSFLQPTTAASKISGLVKKDSSPVTIGDFAAQSLVLNILARNFSEDVLIAEEASSGLEKQKTEDNKNDATPSLADDIMQVIESCGFTSYIGNVDELKRSIDLGQTYQSNGNIIHGVKNLGGLDRRWCLDPIDGTRGFLRGKKEGGQYCVALTLIEDGVPVMGVLGCPNLPTLPNEDNYEWGQNETDETNKKSRGCIFVASKGGGCYQLPLHSPIATSNKAVNEKVYENDEDALTEGAIRIRTTSDDIPVNRSRFCMGVEAYGDPHGECKQIAKKIHGKLNPHGGEILYSRRMDSQVKYGVLARGGAEIFVRLPERSYVEWVWDHAAGRIIVEEAGGIQTDTQGKLIDYGLGAKMDPNVDGILVSAGGKFHDKLLSAYKEMVQERKIT